MIGGTQVLLANVQNGESLAYNLPYENLRLGAVGSALRCNGITVEYYDSAVDDTPLAKRVSALTASPVVIFDTLYRVSEFVVDSVRAVRTVRPNALVMLVGRAAGAIGREPPIARHVDAFYDSSDLAAITAECVAHVGGLDDGTGSSWTTTTPERPFRHLAQRRGIIDVEATKGCAYSCTFCAVDGVIGGRRRQAWQPRAVAEVLAEINCLTLELGVNKIQFVDDNLIGAMHAVPWALAFAEQVQRQELDIRFSCYARLDRALDRVLDPLVAAGLVQVHAGVESGSVAVLRRLCKGTSPDKLARMIHRVRDAGVQLIASLIVFEPRMTLDELEESLNWFRANGLERFFSLTSLIPFEASRAFAELTEYYLPQSGPATFERLGYRFADDRVAEVYRSAMRAEQIYNQRTDGYVDKMMRVRFRQEESLDAPAVSDSRVLSELDNYRLRQIDDILAEIENVRR